MLEHLELVAPQGSKFILEFLALLARREAEEESPPDKQLYVYLGVLRRRTLSRSKSEIRTAWAPVDSQVELGLGAPLLTL